MISKATEVAEARLRRQIESRRRDHQCDLTTCFGSVELPHAFAHNDVKTTMIYTHVLDRGGQGVTSPADFGTLTSE